MYSHTTSTLGLAMWAPSFQKVFWRQHSKPSEPQNKRLIFQTPNWNVKPPNPILKKTSPFLNSNHQNTKTPPWHPITNVASHNPLTTINEPHNHHHSSQNTHSAHKHTIGPNRPCSPQNHNIRLIYNTIYITIYID